MTENFETLEFIHALISEIQEVVAINNAIAGGIVTDPKTVRDCAARSSLILSATLKGHELQMRDGVDRSKINQVFDIVYNNEK